MNDREQRSTIGRYQVAEPLDNHPFGLTYKVIDPESECFVGLKTFFDHPTVMKSGLDVAIVRDLAKPRGSDCFLSYYRIHPVRPLNGALEDRPLLVTEWIEGVTLQELLRIRRSLSPAETATILSTLAQAVSVKEEVDVPALDQAVISPLNDQGEFIVGASGLSTLRTELDRWPQFLIKFDPVGQRLPQPIDHSGQTRIVSPWPAWMVTGSIPKLAYLGYLLQGGRPNISSAAKLSQIPELGESGNDLVHQAIKGRLDPTMSALQFVQKLREMSL